MNDSLVLTDVEEIDKCWVYADPRPGIRAYLRELLATQGNEAVVAELEKATSTIQVRAPDTSAAGLLQDLLEVARAGGDFSD